MSYTIKEIREKLEEINQFEELPFPASLAPRIISQLLDEREAIKKKVEGMKRKDEPCFSCDGLCACREWDMAINEKLEDVLALFNE